MPLENQIILQFKKTTTKKWNKNKNKKERKTLSQKLCTVPQLHFSVDTYLSRVLLLGLPLIRNIMGSRVLHQNGHLKTETVMISLSPAKPHLLSHKNVGEQHDLQMWLSFFSRIALPHIAGLNKFYSRKCQMRTACGNKRKARAAVLTIQCSTDTGFHAMWPAWWGAPLVLAHPASHHEKSLDLQGERDSPQNTRTFNLSEFKDFNQRHKEL